MYVPKIVSESYRDDVRGRMGFSRAELPDDEIMDRIHLAPAEGDVIRAVPNWESVEGLPLQCCNCEGSLLSLRCLPPKAQGNC